MEVNHAKQLHHHTVPIVVLAVGVLFATITGYALYIGNASGQSVYRVLTVHGYSVRPAANGFVHISKVENTTARIDSPTPKLDTVQSAGTNAQLQAAVYAK